MMLLLFGLIFRAVAIEFRSKQPMRWWRSFWDVSFSVSSIGSSLLVGVALGAIARGIPLDEQGEYVGGFLSLLHPYALLVGVTTLALFAMHGSIYILMKTEGELHDRIRSWIPRTIGAFVVCYVATTIVTLLTIPHMTENLRAFPVLFVLPVLNALAIANIPREIHHGHDWRAFLSSCASMAALLALFGVGVYPNIVTSNPIPANSLTVYNAASSGRTLEVMLVIALVGMPLVIAYTFSIYWIFRGKVKLGESSY
jgi:cytochrome d ubiquinol oxidase subunit II